jgi:hypothetical protein
MELRPLKVLVETFSDYVLVKVVNSDGIDAIFPTKFLLDPFINIKENIISILRQRTTMGVNITEVEDNDYNITVEDIQPIEIEQEQEVVEEVVVQTEYDPMSLINGNT